MEKKDEKLKIYINIEPLSLKFGAIFKKNETFQSIINFVFIQTKKIGIKFRLGRIIENKTGAILLTENQLVDFLENGDEITVYSEEYGFISNYLAGDNENNFSKRNFYHKNVSDLYKSLSFLKKKRNQKKNIIKEIKEENYSSEKDEEENEKEEKKETNLDNKHKNQKQNNNKNKGNNKKYNNNNKKQKKDVTNKKIENNQKSDDDKNKDKLNKKNNENKIDKLNEETIETKNDNQKIIEQGKKQTLSDESSLE